MVGRGGRRADLAKMHRDMQNLQRQVADLTDMLANQRIIRREASDEETHQGGVD